MNLPAPTKTLLEKNVKEGSGVKKKLFFEIDRLNGFSPQIRRPMVKNIFNTNYFLYYTQV